MLFLDLPFVVFLNTYGVIILFAIALPYIWFYEKKKEEVLHIIAASVVASIIALVVKDLLSQPRPFAVNGMAAMAGHATTASFPSLHTTLAFSLATTVFLHQRKTGIVLFILAFLIGIGRVMANVHYPLDIVAGALVGLLVSLVIEKVHFKV